VDGESGEFKKGGRSPTPIKGGGAPPTPLRWEGDPSSAGKGGDVGAVKGVVSLLRREWRGGEDCLSIWRDGLIVGGGEGWGRDRRGVRSREKGVYSGG